MTARSDPRLLIPWFAGLIALILFSTAAYAQGDVAPDQSSPINLDIVNEDVATVMRAIAQAADVNVVVAPDVQGTVRALTLRDVPIEGAIQATCVAVGCHWYQRDGIYYIVMTLPPEPAPPPAKEVEPKAELPVPPEESPKPAVELPGEPTAPVVTRDKIAIKHAACRDMALLFGGTVAPSTLSDPSFRPPLPDPFRIGRHAQPAGTDLGSRSLMPAALEQFGGGFGGRGGGRGGGGYGGGGGGYGGGYGGRGGMGGLGGGYGGGMGGQGLTELLPGEMLPPVAYEPDNALIVTGTQQEIDQFRELVELLDVPARQVEIAAQFVQVDTSEAHGYGIDWFANNGALELFAQGIAPSTGAFTARFQTDTFSALLNLLLRANKAKLVNQPRAVALNNGYAEFSIETYIPYFQAEINYNQFGQRTVDYTVDAVDVSNSLYVQPRINADDTITVMLYPELSDQVGEVTGPNGEVIPIVTYQYTTTIARVRDGATSAVGGLIRRNDSLDTVGIPFLSDLPLIGRLFKRQQIVKNDSELIIFVTPRIVRDIEATP
jgi:type II secretory pathway component GspD/PulD (secretin)